MKLLNLAIGVTTTSVTILFFWDGGIFLKLNSRSQMFFKIDVLKNCDSVALKIYLDPIPVTTETFELRISYIASSYVTRIIYPSYLTLIVTITLIPN